MNGNPWRPKFSANVRITEQENSLVLNQLEFGHQLKMGKSSMNFLLAMDGTRTIPELAELYTTSFQKEVVDKDMETFILSQLYSKGFIEGNTGVAKRKQATFLKLRIVLLRASLIAKIKTGFLTSLFAANSFFFLLPLLFVLNLTIFLFYKNNVYQSGSWVIFFALAISHLCHELGHAIAARAKSASPGNIGFGFYYVLPVFYVDLSDTWNLKRTARIIINLSGIFFDYIFGLLMLLLFNLTQNPTFLAIQLFLFFKTFYNLNPFIRSDAYWVIADALERPNLNEDASRSLNNFITSLFKKRLTIRTKYGLLLTAYGFLSILFWVYIIVSILSEFNTISNDTAVLYLELKKWILEDKLDLKIITTKLFRLLYLSLAAYIVIKITKGWFYSIFKKLKTLWKPA